MPPVTFSIPTPGDFDLKRDCCSYGYFLLAPNFWDPQRLELWRVLHAGQSDDARAGAVLVRVSQPSGAGTRLRVQAYSPLDRAQRGTVKQQLTRMLRLDESAEDIAKFHELDPRFAAKGNGRLVRSPTLFEDFIKTVTSCNVQWPGTMEMNTRLCQVIGTKAQIEHIQSTASTRGAVLKPRKPSWTPDAHAFPTPRQLARVRPATLRARCRVGYRDARIVELARLFTLAPARGGIDQAWLESSATSDDAVFKYLVDLPGIGPYAAANIMQLLGRYARLPLDTESVRHGRGVLGFKGSDAQVMKRVKAHFAPFGAHAFRSYWFELREFYESRHGPAWTWRQDTTGRMFTASLLAT